MTHVELRAPHPTEGPGTFQIMVDGVDLSFATLSGSISVTTPKDQEFDTAHVHMTVGADTLEVDLPDAVIHALRETTPRRAFWKRARR